MTDQGKETPPITDEANAAILQPDNPLGAIQRRLFETARGRPESDFLLRTVVRLRREMYDKLAWHHPSFVANHTESRPGATQEDWPSSYQQAVDKDPGAPTKLSLTDDLHPASPVQREGLLVGFGVISQGENVYHLISREMAAFNKAQAARQWAEGETRPQFDDRNIPVDTPEGMVVMLRRQADTVARGSTCPYDLELSFPPVSAPGGPEARGRLLFAATTPVGEEVVTLP